VTAPSNCRSWARASDCGCESDDAGERLRGDRGSSRAKVIESRAREIAQRARKRRAGGAPERVGHSPVQSDRHRRHSGAALRDPTRRLVARVFAFSRASATERVGGARSRERRRPSVGDRARGRSAWTERGAHAGAKRARYWIWPPMTREPRRWISSAVRPLDASIVTLAARPVPISVAVISRMPSASIVKLTSTLV
jgi:hypothetical protein